MNRHGVVVNIEESRKKFDKINNQYNAIKIVISAVLNIFNLLHRMNFAKILQKLRN